MTLGQLAGLLGVGKSTVSYALRGKPMVSAKTREWVQRRARELGYVPNPVASAFIQQIRAGGSPRYQANLAFLIPKKARYAHLKAVQKGAQDRAGELGYGMDVIRCTEEYDAARLTRMLLARGILGVAIGPLHHATGHLSLDWSKFACVAYGYSMARPAVQRIVSHHAQGIRTAMRMCRRKGYRRIGLALAVESDTRSNRLWSSVFLGFQQMLPRAERVGPLLCPLERFSPARIERWALREKPDVVLFHATGCLPSGVKVLADLPWVVLDREPDDPCAGIDQQFPLGGGLLVDGLSSQILHNERGIPGTPVVSLVDGIWVDHPSLPAKE